MVKYKLIQIQKVLPNLRSESRTEMKQLRSRILTNDKSKVSDGEVSEPADGMEKA